MRFSRKPGLRCHIFTVPNPRWMAQYKMRKALLPLSFEYHVCTSQLSRHLCSKLHFLTDEVGGLPERSRFCSFLSPSLCMSVDFGQLNVDLPHSCSSEIEIQIQFRMFLNYLSSGQFLDCNLHSNPKQPRNIDNSTSLQILGSNSKSNSKV